MVLGAAWAWMAVAAACANPALLRAYTAPGWTDVPQHGVASHLTPGVILEGARGEREGAWLVLQPAGPWVDLELTVTELRRGRAVLPPENIRVLRAGYEHAADGRILADAALPLQHSKLRDPRLPESSNLPLWIEFQLPEDLPAGEYRGTVRARIGCESTEVPVRLTVHPLSLPLGGGEVLLTPEQLRGWTPGHALSARRAGVRLLSGGQGGGGGTGWQVPVGDRGAIGLGLGAPGTSAYAIAWLSFRDGADWLLYREGADGLDRSLRRQDALWYPGEAGPGGAPVESIRLLRIRDALEMRALIAEAQRRGQGAEVARWSRRLTPPGGHCSNDPDAYASARSALLRRLGRGRR